MMGTSPIDLIGTWRLERTIDDLLAGETSTVSGQTELSVDPDGRVRWYESGTLTHHGSDLPVFRTLFVEPRPTGWFVTFEDGREFHPWQPGDDVVHPCGDDTYSGHIDLIGPEAWTVTWHSRGPAKDYTMVSRLSR